MQRIDRSYARSYESIRLSFDFIVKLYDSGGKLQHLGGLQPSVLIGDARLRGQAVGLSVAAPLF